MRPARDFAFLFEPAAVLLGAAGAIALLLPAIARARQEERQARALSGLARAALEAADARAAGAEPGAESGGRGDPDPWGRPILFRDGPGAAVGFAISLGENGTLESGAAPSGARGDDLALPFPLPVPLPPASPPPR